MPTGDARMTIQPSIHGLVECFRPLMRRPTFRKLQVLLLAWSLARHRRTVTELIKTLHRLHISLRHHSFYHRFFSRDKWDINELGRRLAELLEPWLPSDEPIQAAIDDVLCRRPGPALLGNGFHHDPLASIATGHHTQRVLAAGLDFVVVALVVPLPFMASKVIAIPVGWELYRTPNTCPEDLHRTRPQLASCLLERVRTFWPIERKVRVSVDDAYSCEQVLRHLPTNIILDGRLHPRARLTAPTVVQSGKGRPRQWGEDLPKPVEVAADTSRPWTRRTVELYGGNVTVDTKSRLIVWKKGEPGQVLKMVITHDVQGRYEKDWYLFSTEPESSEEEVLQSIARRWTIETCFRDVKQILGVETTCNGHKHRRRRGEPRGKRKPGFVADPDDEPVASARTIPFGMLVYGFIVLWYLMAVEAHPLLPVDDVQRARAEARWYRQKIKVSFADMQRTFNDAIHSQFGLHPGDEQMVSQGT